MHLKWNTILVSLLGLVLCFSSIQGQTSDCTIDLQPIITKLTEAQTNASSGNQTDALAQISQAKADLESIEARCGSQTSTDIRLENTFTVTDKSFTFNYPAGWVTGEFSPNLKSFGQGGRMLIGSNEKALEILSKNIDETGKLDPTDQATMIIVGAPGGLLYSLGIYDENTSPKDDSDIKTLTEYLQLAIKDGPLFKEIGDPVYDEQNAQFTFSDTEFEGVVMLKQISAGKFALTLALGDKATNGNLIPLAAAIHNSIQ